MPKKEGKNKYDRESKRCSAEMFVSQPLVTIPERIWTQKMPSAIAKDLIWMKKAAKRGKTVRWKKKGGGQQEKYLLEKRSEPPMWGKV